AEGAVKDEVWASYRFILLYDPQHPDQLRQIDLGAGHASGSSTLTGRVLKALRDEELLNETIGAGYLDRSWPPSLKETGVWPLQGLRQAFMNGSLTRLSDPERVLRERIPEFVERGEFGLGSGQRPDGTFERVWFKEALPQEEVVFDAQTFLLRKQRVETLRRRAEAERAPEVAGAASPEGTVAVETSPGEDASRASLPTEVAAIARLHVRVEVPPEVWNRLGSKLLPKLRTGQNLSLSLTAALDVSSADRARLEQEIRRILQEMGLGGWTVGGKGD
ncbi:MAG: AAA family ATPase, partial [Halobacteria archaeon]